METVKVLNIDIQNITRQELLENLKEGVLVTPNLDHLIKLQKDKEFYDVYQKSEWVVCACKAITSYQCCRNNKYSLTYCVLALGLQRRFPIR